jgi:hypothetical protein
MRPAPANGRVNPGPRRRGHEDIEAPSAVIPLLERRILDQDVADGGEPLTRERGHARAQLDAGHRAPERRQGACRLAPGRQADQIPAAAVPDGDVAGTRRGCKTDLVEDVSGRPPQQITVRLDWSDLKVTSAQHVNQALGQLGPPTKGVPDGIYLALGQVEPEIVLDEESRARLIEGLRETGAKVGVRGRFHLTRELADEIIRILQETVVLYDAAIKAADLARGAEEAQADVDHRS